MKKYMNLSILGYILINGIFLLLVILATVFSMTFASNIIIFTSWVMFVTSLLLLEDSIAKNMQTDMQKKLNKYKTVPRYIDVCFDILITLLLIAHSFWFTGIAYMLHTLLLSIAYLKPNHPQE